ncbi:MAG: tyrosine-type recombinase/integrase [Proteobacteria bacterium]|nr:tyrosine-type recombinase/integrase [Pseudomonadota bacterium]MCP4920284.1 tyrosine-type recombinase/integrase [Pseudomonadota bacterium]
MAVNKRRNKWWIDFRHDGKRIRKKCPLNTRAGAKRYEITLRMRLANGEDIDRDSPERGVAFQDYVEGWLLSYAVTRNRASEVRNKRSILRNHLLPTFGAMPLSAITCRDVESYKTEKLLRGLSAKTVNNHLAVMGRALRSAAQVGVLAAVPNWRPLEVERPLPRRLSADEIERLLSDAEEPVWNVMLHVALRTGMRVGELMGLKWEDIDLNRRTIAVRRSVYRGEITLPKSNAQRVVPTSADLAAPLLRLERRADWVFAPNGQAANYNLARRRFGTRSPYSEPTSLWRRSFHARSRKATTRATRASNTSAFPGVHPLNEGERGPCPLCARYRPR